MTAREEFLAGQRLEDVLVYLNRDAVGNPDALADHAEEVPGGLVLVLPGEQARSVFQQATGVDPMAFAQEAGTTEGQIAADLTGATCPEQDGESEESGDSEGRGDTEESADGEAAHELQFVFAFAEAENQEAGGLYAEGDVIHAYASCSCGASYSHRWVVGDR